MVKPKFLCLALVIGGILWPELAHAFWARIPVNSTNIAATAPFLRIVATDYGITNDSTVDFTVFVLSTNKSAGDVLLSGSLLVRDAHDSKRVLVNTLVEGRQSQQGVVPTAVPKSWAGKYKVFSVSIAANLLTNSEFTVNFTIDPKWGTSGTSYILNLREFAEESKSR